MVAINPRVCRAFRCAATPDQFTCRLQIILWDVNSLQKVAVLPGHTGNVGPVVFSPDGKILASGAVGADFKVGFKIMLAASSLPKIP